VLVRGSCKGALDGCCQPVDGATLTDVWMNGDTDLAHDGHQVAAHPSRSVAPTVSPAFVDEVGRELAATVADHAGSFAYAVCVCCFHRAVSEFAKGGDAVP
jgi:hypothetical protein